MFTNGKISRCLAIAVIGLAITAQAMFVGTAVFAENRENKEAKENSTSQAMESGEQKTYGQYNLDFLASAFDVEPEYLGYIAQVEVTFGLEPYELMALIAQESEFIPQTKMDGNSLSYNATQMKLATAKTAFMAITEYYNMDIAYPTHELLSEDKYYAAMLAGGYLKYLHDIYQDKYESYTAYHKGIGGRLAYYREKGDYKSEYALQVAGLTAAFAQGKVKI